MQGATGAPVGPEALLEATTRALGQVGARLGIKARRHASENMRVACIWD
jgi:hypothetical protein